MTENIGSVITTNFERPSQLSSVAKSIHVEIYYSSTVAKDDASIPKEEIITIIHSCLHNLRENKYLICHKICCY